MLVEPAVGAAGAKGMPARQHLHSLPTREGREAHRALWRNIRRGPLAVLERRQLANIESLTHWRIVARIGVVTEDLSVVREE